MSTRSIVSFATAAGTYARKLERLRTSIGRSGFAGTFRAWSPETLPGGCPEHLDVPFAFKPLALDAARREGSDVALWMDASCVVEQPLDEIFDAIERDGYVLFRNGAHKVGSWMSDVALTRLGVTRDAAMMMPEVNAAAVGLDFRHPKARVFLERWIAEARDGVAFRGIETPYRSVVAYRDIKWNYRGRASSDPRVGGHRHDQSVAGVIAHQTGMHLRQVGLASYESPARTDSRTAIVIDRDLTHSATARVVLSVIRRNPRIRQALRFVQRQFNVVR